MSLLICILVLLVVPVRGIKLPGNCPSVPPTHTRKLKWDNFNYEILFGLPFTEEHPSHLFKDINARNADKFSVDFDIQYDVELQFGKEVMVSKEIAKIGLQFKPS